MSIFRQLHLSGRGVGKMNATPSLKSETGKKLKAEDGSILKPENPNQ